MNYYVKFKERKVKQQDLHIGKDTSSFEFCFKAHYEDQFYNTPQLTSKQEWMEFLFLNDNLIFNEEDEAISFLHFADIVNGSVNKDTKNHYDSLPNIEQYPNYYKDEDGFCFDKTEFE